MRIQRKELNLVVLSEAQWVVVNFQTINKIIARSQKKMEEILAGMKESASSKHLGWITNHKVSSIGFTVLNPSEFYWRWWKINRTDNNKLVDFQIFIIMEISNLDFVIKIIEKLRYFIYYLKRYERRSQATSKRSR